MKQKVNYFFSVLMSLLMFGINCPVMVLADTGQDQSLITTEITHSPVEEAKAGKRISLEVNVEDKAGIEVIRVYFKAIEGAEYNFIVLSGQGGEYSGSLPAPANGVGGIDYLVLVKNGHNKVVKSQTYRFTVKDDDSAGQSIADNDKINVYTELKNPPSEITGFSDNIAFDVVESAAKLGVVAGIYSTTVAGASTGAATAGGTVTASAGGLSTTTIVVGSVAAAAVVGGVAAGSGGGGDDDGGSNADHLFCAENYPREACESIMSHADHWKMASVGSCVSLGADEIQDWNDPAVNQGLNLPGDTVSCYTAYGADGMPTL